MYALETATSVVAQIGMSTEQIASVSTALTECVNVVLDTFIDLLPIIALITGAIFAVRFVKARFGEVKRIR